MGDEVAQLPGWRQSLIILKVKPIFADRLDEGHKKREESRMTPRFIP